MFYTMDLNIIQMCSNEHQVLYLLVGESIINYPKFLINKHVKGRVETNFIIIYFVHFTKLYKHIANSL